MNEENVRKLRKKETKCYRGRESMSVCCFRG